MRRALGVVAVVLGCTEVTVFVQAQDTAADGEAGAVVDTAEPTTDSTAPEEDAPLDIDTGKPMLGDSGVMDFGPPDAKSAEQIRCESGAPRLSWDGAACIDLRSPPSITPAPCVFRVVFSGGLRCLPVLAIHGHVKGVLGTMCKAVGFGSLLDYTTWPENLSGVYFGGTTWSARKLRTTPILNAKMRE